MSPSRLGKVPAEGRSADFIRSRKFEDADRYRRSASRRDAVLTQICRALPKAGDLGAIAHSLGLVVARDLIYHLPARLHLRLLITIGTPLAMSPMREHLEDANRRFPYEIIGPWINVIGAGDPVTAYRGLSQIYSQALDVFVDTGRMRNAHRATAYLVQRDRCRCAGLAGSQGRAGTRWTTPARTGPAGIGPLDIHRRAVQLSTRPSDRTNRRAESGFAEARKLVLAPLAQQISDAGLGESARPNSREATETGCAAATSMTTRSSPTAAVFVLGNPILPYEVDVPRDERLAALEKLAGDLARPARFAKCVVEAEEAARSSHKKPRLTPKRAALAVAGVAVVLAAPALVIAAAPAGLARRRRDCGRPGRTGTRRHARRCGDRQRVGGRRRSGHWIRPDGRNRSAGRGDAHLLAGTRTRPPAVA